MILKRIRKRYSDNKNNKFLIQKDDFRIALFGYNCMSICLLFIIFLFNSSQSERIGIFDSNL